MKKALTILKYLPAVLCGLMVVAWGVSLYVVIGAYTRLPGARPACSYLEVFRGNLKAQWYGGGEEESRWFVRPLEEPEFEEFGWLGRFDAQWQDQGLELDGESNGVDSITIAWLDLPFPLLLTLLLPFSIGPFNRFRFPL